MLNTDDGMFLYLSVQCWSLSLLVEIQHLDSHTLWHVMSVLPVALASLLWNGWDLAALLPLLLVETLLWAVCHPIPSSSTHYASPMLDSTPVVLLLERTLEQTCLWWIFQVCNWAHYTTLQSNYKIMHLFSLSIPGSWHTGREYYYCHAPVSYIGIVMSVCVFEVRSTFMHTIISQKLAYLLK